MALLSLLGGLLVLVGTLSGWPFGAYLHAVGAVMLVIAAIALYRRHRRTRHLLPDALAWLRRL